MTRSPLILGEVLFDCFPDGKKVLGGAPFNVAWNLQGLGFHPTMISAVGTDAEGDQVLSAMSDWNMDASQIQRSDAHATGVVEVTINNGEPQYDILKDRAWDFIRTPQLESYDAYSFLYYGSLAYRSERTAETIRELINSSPLPRFVDLNLRPPWFDPSWVPTLVRGAQWLKLNHEELEKLTGIECDSHKNALTAIEKIRDEHDVANFCITSGSKGALLATKDSGGIEIAVTEPDPLVDTVGAGDAFASVLIAGLITGRPLREVGQAASRFAAKVCQNNGATCRDRSFYENVFS